MVTMNKYLSKFLVGLILLSSAGIVTASTVGEIPMALSSMLGAAGDNNDKASDLNEGAGYFNISGWTKLVKVETPDISTTSTTKDGITTTLALTYTNNDLLAGTWSLSGTPWEDFSSLLIVLKTGRDSATNIFWTASLLSAETITGDWSMASKELSHMTVYGSNELLTLSTGIQVAPSKVSVSAVPVPAAVWLFASALLGLTGISRQRKA